MTSVGFRILERMFALRAIFSPHRTNLQLFSFLKINIARCNPQRFDVPKKKGKENEMHEMHECMKEALKTFKTLHYTKTTCQNLFCIEKTRQVFKTKPSTLNDIILLKTLTNFLRQINL